MYMSRISKDRDSAVEFINTVYRLIVNILYESAKCTVPARPKNFYKFWWCQELDVLKDNSMRDHSIWKNAGRPRSGPIFNAYRTSKVNYKRRIRQYERQEMAVYTNDLHEALLNKRRPDFWKCWRSKFECEKKHDYLIDGTSNNKEAIDKFVDYFKKIGCNLSENGNKALYDKYVSRRENYTGFIPVKFLSSIQV